MIRRGVVGMALVKLTPHELKVLKERGEVYLARKVRRIGKVIIYNNGKKVGVGQLEVVGDIMKNNGEWAVQVNGRMVYLKELTDLSGYSNFEEWKDVVRRAIGSFGQCKLYKLTVIRLF